MLFQRALERPSAAVDIRATVFRDDRSADTVNITELAFDQCLLSSSATFAVGEHLRVHVTGQGWIDAKVQWTSDGEVSVVFASECKV